jgi:hypothetical protein
LESSRDTYDWGYAVLFVKESCDFQLYKGFFLKFLFSFFLAEARTMTKLGLEVKPA